MKRNPNRNKEKWKSEYYAWHNMKVRCLNPNDGRYKHYGARGIKICDRWLNSFDNFLSDMGPKPSAGHSIERIDVNGDYEPDNCKWATRNEQQNNTTQNRFIAYNGETLTLQQWSRRLGINHRTLHARLDKYGWLVERAFSTPVLVGRNVKKDPE